MDFIFIQILFQFQRSNTKLLFLKIKIFGLSIYGHSLETFKKFTNSNDVSYKKLLENLNYLYELISNSKIGFKLQIGKDLQNFFIKKIIMIYLNFKKLIKINNIEYAFTEDFNNWGGIVDSSDVSDLNID